jgi:hypothetical protein
MRKRFAVAWVLVCFVGCINSPHDTPLPVMGWQQLKTDTFVMSPGGIVTGYYVPKGTKPAAFKVQISAIAPISVAYVPELYRETVMNTPDYAKDLLIYSCQQGGVLQTTLQCPLDTSSSGYFLWLHDERTTSGAVAGAVLGGLGIKGPAEQQLVRNDVHVEYSIYTCVQNCR